MSTRWVVVGLAPAASEWFRRLAGWAAAGTLPVEVLRCHSATELRARVDSTRPISAALVDGAVPGLDRDLLDPSRTGCPIVVVDPSETRPWLALGAAAVLRPDLDASQLLDVLAAVGRPVAHARGLPGDPAVLDDAPVVVGRLIAVCGPGGTGATTTAIALAQGVSQGAGGSSLQSPVVLADLCRRGDLAMLHDARDVVVGTQELVEAHRADRPTPTAVRTYCLPIFSRGYDLLTGVRQPRAWTALRPRAVAAAVTGLRSAYATVVADLEAEMEGELETGSLDVEERHALARCTALAADVTLAVGQPGLHGIHALVRAIHELIAAGVDPPRILPVVNRAPPAAAGRAELTQAVAELCATRSGLPAPPLFLLERSVEDALRTTAALPRDLCTDVAAAVAAVVDRLPLVPPHREPVGVPRPVRPGTLRIDEADVW